jgi:hypothetical protein
VLAAEISTRPGDFSQLRPMLAATHLELEQAGIPGRPQVAHADAGFWNEQHMDDLAADGITVLIQPDAGNAKGEGPGWTGGRYSWMRQPLTTDIGGGLYRKRRVTIESGSFDEKWAGRLPVITKAWRDSWDYVIPFLVFEPEVRRIIYTTTRSKRSTGS